MKTTTWLAGAFVVALGGSTLCLAEDAPAWAVPVTGRCIGAVAEVTMSELGIAADHFHSAGTWAAAGGADGVALEYRVDSNRHQAEVVLGPKGDWSFEESIDTVECGLHALRVWAYPVVQEDGRERVCLTPNATSAQKTIKVSCAPRAQLTGCHWQCTEGKDAACTGSCTGSASRGHPGYVPFWGVNDREQSGPYGAGPWTTDLACKAGDRVTFRVRDGNGFGLWSEKVESTCGTP